jgi:uncharacterized protein
MRIAEPTRTIIARNSVARGVAPNQEEDGMAIQQVDQETFGLEWQQWHQQHERDLADPHGFLAVTGLYWLSATPERFPGAPGLWSSDDTGARVTLGGGEELEIDGVTVRDAYDFGIIPERGGRTAAFGDAVVEVAKRGGRDILRPRHPDNPLRTNFTGVPTYGPNPRWVFAGEFLPFESAHPVTVEAAVEGIEHVYESPGQVEFEYQGETFLLTTFDGKAPGSLLVLFTDATSGITTYAASRALLVEEPDDEGNVVLDFNRAVNLPCAFTDLATCPLAPPENRLPIGIEAGEKTPYQRA